MHGRASFQGLPMPAMALPRARHGLSWHISQGTVGIGIDGPPWYYSNTTGISSAFMGLPMWYCHVIPMGVPRHGKALPWVFMAPTATVMPGNAMSWKMSHENE